MGYKEKETRQRVVMNVQYLFPNEQEVVGDITGLLYDNLFHGYLPEHLHLKFLVELCKRGWEYFSFFVGNFINILKKYRHLKEEAFIEEVELSMK
jgi:hypothetical protein